MKLTAETASCKLAAIAEMRIAVTVNTGENDEWVRAAHNSFTRLFQSPATSKVVQDALKYWSKTGMIAGLFRYN
jgi:hypothetical protein